MYIYERTISRADPTIPNGCRTHLSSLVINVKILAKHGSHRLATEYRLVNTKEQLTNGRLLSAILFRPLLLSVGTRTLVIRNYSFIQADFYFLFLTVWFLPSFLPSFSLLFIFYFRAQSSWNRLERKYLRILTYYQTSNNKVIITRGLKI